MAIPSRQIGWSAKANLLWEISKQLELLTQVMGNVNLHPVPPTPTSDWTTVTGGAAGDGTVAQYATNGFNITGPDDDVANGWVYIKQYFPDGAQLNIDYQWASVDEGLSTDRPIYCIDETEPTGAPSDNTARVENTPETGTWNITVPPGNWFSVGIYSNDSCCGRGFLSVDIVIDPYTPTTTTTTTTNPGYYTYSLGSTSTETSNCLTGPVSPGDYYSADSVLTIGTKLYVDTSLTIEVELGQIYFNTTGKYNYGATGIEGIIGFQNVNYAGGGLVSDVSQADACTGSFIFNAFVACGTVFDNGTILYNSPTLSTPFTGNAYFSYGGFSYTVGAVNPGELSNKTAC